MQLTSVAVLLSFQKARQTAKLHNEIFDPFFGEVVLVRIGIKQPKGSVIVTYC